MLELFRTSSFKSDYKKLNADEKLMLKEIVSRLAASKPLSLKHKDHPLVGSYLGCRECHVKPDLLLSIK